MKVKCVRYFDSRRRPATNSRWLTLDKVYHVMGMRKGANQTLDYLIIANDRDPPPASVGYFPAESFEVIDSTVPPSWRESTTGSSVLVMPGSWLEDGFFDRFFEWDQSAIAVFEHERDLVLKSEF